MTGDISVYTAILWGAFAGTVCTVLALFWLYLKGRESIMRTFKIQVNQVGDTMTLEADDFEVTEGYLVFVDADGNGLAAMSPTAWHLVTDEATGETITFTPANPE